MPEGTGFQFIALLDAFGAGVYLLFTCIHLDLWLRRRVRMGHLWLACASLAALVVDVTGLLVRIQGADVPRWIEALNAMGVAVVTGALFELVSTLARVPSGRLARGAQALLLVLAPSSVLLLPILSVPVLAACFILLFWAMGRAFKAARGGDRDSVIVAQGFMVLNLCLLSDLLRMMEVLPIPSGLPILGFIVLFLASARSLNDRIGREEEASRTDPLTGLPNRRGFLEASEEILEACSRLGLPISVVLADLDRFKDVNDTLGHAAGDHLLKSVATSIRASLRSQDIVARWGGDEIVLLLPETDMGDAVRVAGKLRAAVEALSVEHGGGRVHATLSLGVAGHARDAILGETIARADAALYRAKEEGRNRVAAE